jgi:hypothetical protein
MSNLVIGGLSIGGVVIAGVSGEPADLGRDDDDWTMHACGGTWERSGG